MSPHGYPDFGHSQEETVIAVSDMSEVAARLGSINTLNRSGTVIFQDDGELGLLPYTVSGFAGTKIYRSLNPYLISGSGITTEYVEAVYMTGTISLGVPMNKQSLQGIEFKYTQVVAYGMQWSDIILDNTLTERGVYSRIFVKISPKDRKIYVDQTPYNNTNWVAIYDDNALPNSPLRSTRSIHIKIVTDYVTGEYKYLTLNGVVISLSGYYCQHTTTTNADFNGMNWQVKGYSQSTVTAIGDIIITHNEIDRKDY